MDDCGSDTGLNEQPTMLPATDPWYARIISIIAVASSVKQDSQSGKLDPKRTSAAHEKPSLRGEMSPRASYTSCKTERVFFRLFLVIKYFRVHMPLTSQ